MAATKLSTIVRQVQKASPTQHDYAVFELQERLTIFEDSNLYFFTTWEIIEDFRIRINRVTILSLRVV
jgi:hypothetical protein